MSVLKVLKATALVGVGALALSGFGAEEVVVPFDAIRDIPRLKAFGGRDCDFCNVGSNSGLFGFDWESAGVSGANFATGPQSLAQGFALLEHFADRLAKDCTVFIPICPFSSISVPDRYGPERQYKIYPFMSGKDIYLWTPERAAAVDKAVAEATAKWTGADPRLLEADKPVAPEAFRASVDSLLKCWRKDFEIADFTAPLSVRNRRAFLANAKIMRKGLEMCRAKGWRTIVVLPPVTRYYDAVFPDGVWRRYVDDFVAATRVEGVPYWDYSRDARFRDDANFFNSLMMNRRGRALFTAELVRRAKEKPALVLRFDDNKPPVQWREIAEIFEGIGGRCSFAVNAATLTEEQWTALGELSKRGHEIMDHTGQHAVVRLLLQDAAEAEKCRSADFFDHVEGDGRTVLCRPEVDLAHPKNVRVKASMTAGLLRSDDPRFVATQHFSQKFYVPSTDAFYGLGKNCGAKLFKKGPEQKCSDFWGRWTTNSFETCEIVLLANDAVQPSKDLLRAQAKNSLSRFAAHGLPAPKTWIRPGDWETSVDWRRMKAVYGDEFGYRVADSTCGEGHGPYSPWCYHSDFAFFDSVPDVEKVYRKAAKALAGGHSFAYISHQWTKDRKQYLDLCRGLAAKLKENGVRLTTYSHIAD